MAYAHGRPLVVNKIADVVGGTSVRERIPHHHGGSGEGGGGGGGGGGGMFKHPGMYALAVAAMCFVALNLVDDGGGAVATSGAATDGGPAARTKSPFDVVASAAAAPRTQVMNLSPDASLEDLSKPREDATRVVVKATTDGDRGGGDDDAEVDGSATGGKMPPPALPKSDRERLSILARARPEDVRLEPYPYIVVKDALHPATYAQLSSSYPKYKDVVRVAKGEGRNVAPNTRVDIRASMLGEAGGVLTPLWKEFVEYHTSRAFFLEVLDLFEDAIRANHGYLERAPDGVKRSLRELTTRVRLTEEAKPGKCDVAMDAQIGVNTPVKGKPAPVRGPHIDNVHEIYAALLYMRHKKDPATGGALEVYRCTKPGKSGGKGGKAGGVNKKDGCKEYSADERASRRAKVGYDVQFDPSSMETVATVPYEANTLAMFINSKTSYHGVTPRSASGGYPRRLVNVIGEIPFVSTFVKPPKKDTKSSKKKKKEY